MASGRITLGRLVAIAACLAFVVAGCGGSSSSAPGTTGNATATTPRPAKPASEVEASETATAPSKRVGRKEAGESNVKKEEPSSKDQGGNGKKHPPLKLPEGPPEPKITQKQKEQTPTAAIEAVLPDGLTAANTCEGKNVSPAISWGKVPPGTAELAIFAVNVQPVDGQLEFDWAVAGIDPSLTGLKAGEVPAGAVLGRNGSGGNGYSLCPNGEKPETYIFSVYAITKGLSPKAGFEALGFRKQASQASEEVGVAAATFGG